MSRRDRHPYGFALGHDSLMHVADQSVGPYSALCGEERLTLAFPWMKTTSPCPPCSACVEAAAGRGLELFDEQRHRLELMFHPVSEDPAEVPHLDGRPTDTTKEI